MRCHVLPNLSLEHRTDLPYPVLKAFVRNGTVG